MSVPKLQPAYNITDRDTKGCGNARLAVMCVTFPLKLVPSSEIKTGNCSSGCPIAQVQITEMNEFESNENMDIVPLNPSYRLAAMFKNINDFCSHCWS